MAKVLKVEKVKAVSLFMALGFKTASKWDVEKLTEKINLIEEAPAEALPDEVLDNLLDEILGSEQVEVVDDVKSAKKDKKATEDADEDGEKEVETTAADVEEAEEAEEAEKKPAKKSKSKKGKDKKTNEKKANSAKKGKEKKVKNQKVTRKPKSKSIDQVTLDCLQTGKGVTIEHIHAVLIKEFPNRDPDSMLRTTKCRLSGYLQTKFGVKITKSDKGLYSIK